MSETWLPVIGYEGFYSVSDQGHVRSEARTVIVNRRSKTYVRTYVQKILNCGMDQDGYPQVVLSRNGIKVMRRIGHLVLEAFDRPRRNGELMRHRDGFTPNNAQLKAIRWGTHAENVQDSVRLKTHRNARKTECDKGHRYDADNTRITKGGKRRCKTCDRNNDRKRQPRKRLQLHTAEPNTPHKGIT